MSKIRSAIAAFAAATVLWSVSAAARPAIVIDADTGRVLHAEDATREWFPASLTKLMTVYVVLSKVKSGQVSLDTPLLYTERAQREPPSKMGFPLNTIITVDNALKLLMVKSANDLAITLAEGTGGSVEAFVADMNRTAFKLGMTQSHFENPNGWHNPAQYTSARDMAILARAIYRDFPNSAGYYDIQAIMLGKKLVRGHNRILGRFEGADGMKTGFTCPSGFNLVASAQRGKRHLIAVVLGHATAAERTQRAAELLDSGFGSFSFWRTGQSVETLPAVAGDPPDLRPEVCGKKKKSAPEIGETEDDSQQVVGVRKNEVLSGLVTSAYAAENKPLLLDRPAPVVPVQAFLGPNPNGPPALIALAATMAPAAPAAPAASDTTPAAAAAGPAVPMPKPRPAKAKK